MNPKTTKLLAWYRRYGRPLPWRNTRNAYRIYISEIMLQQTQVDRVIPKYHAWLTQFPSWKTLASSSTAALLHAWAGLGYNRRALQVREAAKRVVANSEPTDETGWKQLPGVGPYTAAALAEFVNHQRAIVIDTNVRRVAGRLLLGIPHPTPNDDNRLRRALEKAIPNTGKHWDVPQAFMDLGSSMCTPRNPSCATCPLRDVCPSSRGFINGSHPVRTTIRATERIHSDKKFPDRIYRGRILAWIRMHGATPVTHLGAKIDPTFSVSRDDEWVRALAERLVHDGLLRWEGTHKLNLPH